MVECSLKAVIAHHLSVSTAKTYRHNLTALQGQALAQLRVLVPQAHLRLPASHTHGTVLENGHPERRYWSSGQWSDNEVRTAITRASEIYRDTVVAMVLDGALGWQELVV